jgi:hydrogenase expression/formation protein HypE
MPPHLEDDQLHIGKLPGSLLGQLISGLNVADPSVIVGPGIGRDAAAVRIGDAILVLKSDPITFASSGAARYLLNVNANDLACLGATPKWMLVTMMFPLGTTRGEIESTFSELSTVSHELGISLVGGHTEITPSVNQPVLVGMLTGLADESTLLPPGGAKAGDLLVLSQPVAIEGTALLASELADRLQDLVGSEVVDRARNLLEQPGLSVVQEARFAQHAVEIHAMHDPTEGGIAMGAREIAEASGLGAELFLDRIPILPETRAIAGALGIDPIGMLASGSLLVACAKPDARALVEAWKAAGCEPAIIGRLHDADLGHTLVDGMETRELPAFFFDEVSRALRAGR